MAISRRKFEIFSEFIRLEQDIGSNGESTHLGLLLFVRARPCFTRGVFRVPKNGMRKTNKPPAMRVVENA